MISRPSKIFSPNSGNLEIWDLENMQKPIFSVKGHDKIINCMDGCGGLDIGGGAPEIVTGSIKGCITKV